MPVKDYNLIRHLCGRPVARPYRPGTAWVRFRIMNRVHERLPQQR
jgi:hypothetical protein